jgi:Xaa-Pro aminopeptidase
MSSAHPGAERAERLAGEVAEHGLDQLIVGDLVRPGDSDRSGSANIRWLTGFGGTSGICLIGPDERVFATDFRYVERAEREVPSVFDRVRAERQLVPAIADRMSGRVGFDDANTSVANLHKLEEAVPDGVELVPASGIVEKLRRTKDEAEIEAIAAAARLTDEVYAWVAEAGLAGRTEREVGLAMEQRMRELGAEDPSFRAIVAAGANGALPHHDASVREIGAGELVVIDMGAIVGGYCSDCTRTFATGDLDDELARMYETCLEAQLAGLAAMGPGVSGRDADAAARNVIAAAGWGEEFGHGLGHGIGLEVHEAPYASTVSTDTLEAGNVLSCEPGIYVPGRAGVRIEDMVLVTDEGRQRLTHVGKELQTVS